MRSSYTRMAAMAAAQPDALAGVVQPCESLENDEQFMLLDIHTGVPVKNRRYEITGPGVYHTGTTDSAGRTQRIFTGSVPRNLRVTSLPEEGSVEGTRGDWSNCV